MINHFYKFYLSLFFIEMIYFKKKNILIELCLHDFQFKFIIGFHLNYICVWVSFTWIINFNFKIIIKFKIMKELSINYFVRTKLLYYVLIWWYWTFYFIFYILILYQLWKILLMSFLIIIILKHKLQ